MFGELLLAYDETIEFLMSAPTPEEILAFHQSEGTEGRVRYLLSASHKGTMTQAEQEEMLLFEACERMIRILKQRARDKLHAPAYALR